MLTEHESVRPLQLRRLGNAGDMAGYCAPALFPAYAPHPGASRPCSMAISPVAHDTIFPPPDFIDQRRRPVVQLAGWRIPTSRGQRPRGKLYQSRHGESALWQAPLPRWWRSNQACEPPLWLNTPSRIRRIPLLRMVAQAQQRRIAAKLRINATIILGIIFMHARGDKYRVQVQRRHAKLFQVRQPLADTIEIAAVKGGTARLGG